MTNDFKNDDKLLSFKEQILRDLEQVKKQRAEGEDPFKTAKTDLMDTTELGVFKKLNASQSGVAAHSVPTEIPTVPPMTRKPSVRVEATSSPETSAPQLSKLEATAPKPIAQVVEETPAPPFTSKIKPVYVDTTLPPTPPATEMATTSPTLAPTEPPIAQPKIAVVPAEEVTVAALSKKKAKKARPAQVASEEEVLLSRASKKKRQNRIAKRIVAVLSTIILLVLTVTLVVSYSWIKTSLAPVNSKSKDYVAIEIPVGSNTSMIGDILESEGLIKNATVFNFFSKLKNYANFQSGYFNLSPNMTLDEIALALQEPGTDTPQEPVLGKITIPEGYTLKQIAKAVEKNTKSEATSFTEKEFLAKVQDESFISKMSSKYPTLLATLPTLADGVKYRLEGYLFPATYEYTESTDVENLIDQMLAAMDANLAAFYDTIAASNLTVNETLTLASLVEKEGSTDDDRKNIASTFYNRMAIDMPLQSNIAILYAQGKVGEKTTLREDAEIDTQIDSPYNIYVNPGLMPGPVDSPSLSALTAVIEPAETTYYYFVADVTTGKVYFAETFEEHSANVLQYVNANLN